MYNDIRRRAPFYWSDFKDAWDYRVVPATVYMYFAKYVYMPIYRHLMFHVSIMRRGRSMEHPHSSIYAWISSGLDCR